MKINYYIPENYFDTLPDRMMSRIAFEDRKSAQRRTVLTKFLTYASAAVICCGMVSDVFMKKSEIFPAPGRDYVREYTEDLASKSTDAAVLYYTTEDDAVSESVDLSDVADIYPSPVTIDYYDF